MSEVCDTKAMYVEPFVVSKEMKQLLFSGNILTAFAPGFVVQIIKLGFVLSVAVSFPLVVFPCRTSIYSLLFRKVTYSY